MAAKIKVGILGASGYTGAELVRLLLRHPRAEIAVLTADRRAGQQMRSVFPQFSPFELPPLVSIEGLDWAALALDVVFCALPHATTQKVLSDLLQRAPETKVVDLSADFRLQDTGAYARWYGHDHQAPQLQAEAVYGRLLQAGIGADYIQQIVSAELKKYLSRTEGDFLLRSQGLPTTPVTLFSASARAAGSSMRPHGAS